MQVARQQGTRRSRELFFFFSSFFQYLVRMTLGMPICEGARDKRCKGGRGKRNLSALGFFSPPPNGFLSDFLCVCG